MKDEVSHQLVWPSSASAEAGKIPSYANPLMWTGYGRASILIFTWLPPSKAGNLEVASKNFPREVEACQVESGGYGLNDFQLPAEVTIYKKSLIPIKSARLQKKVQTKSTNNFQQTTTNFQPPTTQKSLISPTTLTPPISP